MHYILMILTMEVFTVNGQVVIKHDPFVMQEFNTENACVLAKEKVEELGKQYDLAPLAQCVPMGEE